MKDIKQGQQPHDRPKPTRDVYRKHIEEGLRKARENPNDDPYAGMHTTEEQKQEMNTAIQAVDKTIKHEQVTNELRAVLQAWVRKGLESGHSTIHDGLTEKPTLLDEQEAWIHNPDPGTTNVFLMRLTGGKARPANQSGEGRSEATAATQNQPEQLPLATNIDACKIQFNDIRRYYRDLPIYTTDKENESFYKERYEKVKTSFKGAEDNNNIGGMQKAILELKELVEGRRVDEKIQECDNIMEEHDKNFKSLGKNMLEKERKAFRQRRKPIKGEFYVERVKATNPKDYKINDRQSSNDIMVTYANNYAKMLEEMVAIAENHEAAATQQRMELQVYLKYLQQQIDIQEWEPWIADESAQGEFVQWLRRQQGYFNTIDELYDYATQYDSVKKCNEEREQHYSQSNENQPEPSSLRIAHTSAIAIRGHTRRGQGISRQTHEEREELEALEDEGFTREEAYRQVAMSRYDAARQQEIWQSHHEDAGFDTYGVQEQQYYSPLHDEHDEAHNPHYQNDQQEFGQPQHEDAGLDTYGAQEQQYYYPLPDEQGETHNPHYQDNRQEIWQPQHEDAGLDTYGTQEQQYNSPLPDEQSEAHNLHYQDHLPETEPQQQPQSQLVHDSHQTGTGSKATGKGSKVTGKGSKVTGKTIAELEQKVRDGVPGAKEALERFRARKKRNNKNLPTVAKLEQKVRDGVPGAKEALAELREKNSKKISNRQSVAGLKMEVERGVIGAEEALDDLREKNREQSANYPYQTVAGLKMEVERGVIGAEEALDDLREKYHTKNAKAPTVAKLEQKVKDGVPGAKEALNKLREKKSEKNRNRPTVAKLEQKVKDGIPGAKEALAELREKNNKNRQTVAGLEMEVERGVPGAKEALAELREKNRKK